MAARFPQGDRVAQLVERRTQVQRPEVRTPVRSTRKICETSGFPSQKCADLLSQTPVCIRTHKNDHARTLAIMYVVHVKVWCRITETQKDPACTLGGAALVAAVALPR